MGDDISPIFVYIIIDKIVDIMVLLSHGGDIYGKKY